MAAYFALIVAVLSRILPHTFGTTSVGFTAVGGGLLYFGARRGRWQGIFAVLALMATDFYLTTYVYNYPFHVNAYVVTWLWYAGVCLFGHQVLASKPSASARRGSRARNVHLVLRSEQPGCVGGKLDVSAYGSWPGSLLRRGDSVLCQ